ncbi:hypothetical protein JY651_29770 [Pyxidicoccus parkwayensis]|uniref:Protein kinase domain-containing protein n=1 Tax=Pyxidicoccus parkwayensis TaxID=2813578 RepID=A0ABX7NMB3_9BACT|nr:hypothetical protein [Pyxidicoccus parkwaysis]QSQ19494.1 hypothetical protein JY651_29770 [Pyxidicoccus parkwaysis]
MNLLGGWSPVRLIDFGTSRERDATDDTWTDVQVMDYLRMRVDLASPILRAPLEVGLILPEDEAARLLAGVPAPPRQLDVLPRIIAVDAQPAGMTLPRLLQGPLLSAVAARGVLAAMLSGLEAIRRWATSPANTTLLPGHLELEVWVGFDGHVEVCPLFRFVPGADSIHPLGHIPPGAPSFAQAGSLEPMLRSLLKLAEVDGHGDSLKVCRSIDERLEHWSHAGTEVPVFDSEGRTALAEHLQLHFRDEAMKQYDAAASLQHMPRAGPEVRRWRMLPLSVVHSRVSSQ